MTNPCNVLISDRIASYIRHIREELFVTTLQVADRLQVLRYHYCIIISVCSAVF